MTNPGLAGNAERRFSGGSAPVKREWHWKRDDKQEQRRAATKVNRHLVVDDRLVRIPMMVMGDSDRIVMGDSDA